MPIYTEFYEDYLPFQKKFDVLGMAKHEVLHIPTLGVLCVFARDIRFPILQSGTYRKISNIFG